MKVFGGSFSFLLAAVALALSACGPANNSATAPAGPASEQYTWDAEAPSTVNAGPPARMNLSQGYGSAILGNTTVNPGDAVTARYSIQGTANKYVRVMIIRHCSPEAGDAYRAEDVLLTGERQQGEIALTFSQPYDCVRVHFVSNGFNPLRSRFMTRP